MNIQAIWQGQMKFSATGQAGYTVPMDADVEGGGEALGNKPTELVLMGIAGCSGIDIVQILTKMRETVKTFRIEVEGERADSQPRRFTEIHVTYYLEGEIKPISVEKAVRLSLDKYCSVSNSLNATFFFACEVNGVRFPAMGFSK